MNNIPPMYRLYGFWVFALALLAYYSCVIFYTVDIPKFDDYQDAFVFLNGYSQAETGSEKWHLMFGQNNEHIFFANHLVYLLWYWVLGDANFTAFVLTGSLSVALVAFAILKGAGDVRRNDYLIVVGLLCFSFFTWRSSVWATTAISNFTVIAFAFLACLFLGKKSIGALFAAMIFASISVFSQGNGVLILFIGFLQLSVAWFQGQASKRYVFLWTVFCILCLGLFFSEYEYSGMRSVGAGWNEYITNYIEYFVSVAQWFFLFIGGAFYYEGSGALSIGLGVFVFSLAVWLFAVFGFNRFPLLFWFCLFLLLSVGLLSLSLGKIPYGFFGVQARYKIYSVYFLAIVFVLLLEFFKEKNHAAHMRMFCVLTVLSAAIFSYSYWQAIPKMNHYKFVAKNGMKAWVVNNNLKEIMALMIKGADGQLYKAIALDLWDPYEVIEGSPILRFSEEASSCGDDFLHKKGKQRKALAKKRLLLKGRRDSLGFLLNAKGFENSERFSLCSNDGVSYTGSIKYPEWQQNESKWIVDRQNLPAGTYYLAADGNWVGVIKLKNRNTLYLNALR